MQKKRNEHNYQHSGRSYKYQSPWKMRKLTEGNDIFSILWMIGFIIVMSSFVVALAKPKTVEANGPLEIRNESTLISHETSITTTSNTNESEVLIKENGNEDTIEVESQSSQENTEGSKETYGPFVKSIDDIKPTQPQDLMEDYDKDVYISYQGGVNIRSIPSTDGEILGSLEVGTKVHIIKRGDGWLYTDTDDFIYEGGTSETEPRKLVSLGNFKFTAYCTCVKCCGKNSKNVKTRSGTTPIEGRTISVDPKIIPLGTTVVIDGHEYIAEDTGSAIHGKIIDLFIDGHQRALKYGVQHHEVFIYQ